ncbi:hypothetical protein ACFQ3J_20770 [Paenibacillus provencensis]|uniref:YtkA-like n=1 Tax=Paenibacillus provencensis TaxID=441151 RepID=A0ABW3PX85_9BACL
MKKAIIYIVGLVLTTYILAGCSSDGLDNKASTISIAISEAQTDEKQNVRVTATLNDAMTTTQDSWFMFEIRKNGGPTWIPGEYEGSGVYAAEVNSSELEQGYYELFGHFYAGSGIHFSRKYAPQS